MGRTAAHPSASAAEEAIFARTTDRYRGVDKFTFYYVASKLRRDPVNADLLALSQTETFGRVADLGCGRGQLAVALLEGGRASSVAGCDWAGPSLTRAQRAAQGLNFTARVQDLATDQTVPPCDTALLIDVLYLLGRQAALALLQAAAGAASNLVLVRTHDPSLGWRGRLTVTLEHLARRIVWNSGKQVDPISPATVAATLEAAGFTVSAAPCWRGTPYSNVLLVARRRPRNGPLE